MKKIKLLIVFVFCAIIGFVGDIAYERMGMSDAEKFMISNIEALTSGESGGGTTMVICRCHDDKLCYGGNSISFRPRCSYDVIGNNGNAWDCHGNGDSICQNLR